MRLINWVFSICGCTGAITVLRYNPKWIQFLVFGYLGAYFGYDLSKHINEKEVE